MSRLTLDTIPGLLQRDLPRELILTVEKNLIAGAQLAYAASQGINEGHLPHAVGQSRHFRMNEAFHSALEISGASPTPIRGNDIVIGQSGIFRLARINTRGVFWNNARRSLTRRQMSLANAAIEPLVQPGLFNQYSSPSEAVAFFVACFSGSLRIQPDAPVSIQIAVPDRDMRDWLFREPLNMFLERYEQKPAAQDDLAKPQLKKIRKQGSDNGAA